MEWLAATLPVADLARTALEELRAAARRAVRVGRADLAHPDVDRGAQRDAVHGDATRAANAFATIGVEGNRILALLHELRVESIQEFGQGHLRRGVVHDVRNELAGVCAGCLAPHVKGQFHGRSPPTVAHIANRKRS